jgi:V/A-type H+-transporting ATPase subunit E
MSIEKIIEKIISDAEKEAREIVESAKRQAEEELKRFEEQKKLEALGIIERAKKEAENIKNRMASRIELERRKVFSESLDKMINELIALASEKLLKLSIQDQRLLFANIILASGARGSEKIRFSERLKKLGTKEFLTELNRKAKEKGLASSFSIDDGTAEEGDIELAGGNYTIKIDLKSVIEEERSRITKLLQEKLKEDKK